MQDRTQCTMTKSHGSHGRCAGIDFKNDYDGQPATDGELAALADFTEKRLLPMNVRGLPYELTDAELETVPDGTELHFTNWPGKPSRPVTRVHDENGNITFAGTTIFAMPDELTWVPRAGLEVHAERES